MFCVCLAALIVFLAFSGALSLATNENNSANDDDNGGYDDDNNDIVIHNRIMICITAPLALYWAMNIN